ncbi:hypothetical protein [Enhygromyxa salina]|uniref:Uncharacterized protein n=1 Tax=Enhygromyxa salina TaxID=215803 RepID=A0A2S9YRL5_9BACT|nr:hypothetical protein [Enhygromyxa salina]PRQ07699.1 hypothetical protein ENSA7_26890 [Enhygromyxa salina]
MRDSTFALTCRSTFTALGAALVLTACPTEDPPPVSDTGTETGEPSCLDTESPGPDIVINTDAEIEELQLGECVPERIIITSTVTNLTGLSNLREVGILEIRFAPTLTTLLGLGNLERVDTLIITGNNAMPALIEFKQLASVGSITITGNSGLTDLGSFPALTSARRLEIAGNDDLTDYSGFEALTSLTGSLELWDAAIIENFVGLENLVSVGGDLRIEDNKVLTSFDGLGVTSIGGDLKVLTNEKLSECLVEDFAAVVDVGGATILSGNKVALCD